MTRVLAVVLSVTLAAPGCASMRANRAWIPMPSSQAPPDRALLAGYVKQIPAGTRIRTRLTDGSTLRGTLLKADDQGIVMQLQARIPEPPRTVPIDQIGAVDLESQSGIGKAVAIGVAVGAGTTLGLLLLLAAVFAGD
jgi:hypothetical protein